MASEGGKRVPRLPVEQLAILVVCRVAEPIVLTSIYPYLPEMIESFGVTKDQIPKWAGITNSVFSISQCFTAILWGRLSDRIGRKPAIIFGLSCTLTCALIFGFSRNLAMAIIARSLQGAFNGNIGTIRTMVAEMVTEKELQPRAFSLMPMIWSIGSIFGPSFGGFFAKPAQHMPKLFGHNEFFIKYPFALPNILASAIFAVGISTAILFLKETHILLRHRKDYGLLFAKKIRLSVHKLFIRLRFVKKPNTSTQSHFSETSPLIPQSNSPNPPPLPSNFKRATTLSEVFSKQTTLNLITYAFLCMHNISFDQLLPIFMHNPPATVPKSFTIIPIKFSGGFGLDSSRIGVLSTITGILSCVFQFVIFPRTARRFGVLPCFKASAIIFPVIYFLTPYVSLFRSSQNQQIFILILMIVKCLAIVFAFPCSLILLTNTAKSLRVIATLNGFAVSVASIGRAVGPVICGPAFSWGIRNEYIITPWWLLSIISIIAALPIWWMVEGEGLSNPEAEEAENMSKSDDIRYNQNGSKNTASD